MTANIKTILPGMAIQFGIFEDAVPLKDKKILVIGSGNASNALNFYNVSGNLVDLIVEDNDSLLDSKYALNGASGVRVRLMDFCYTDFEDSEFDAVYAQSSIERTNRNKILKEIKRILKPEGHLCIGEIVSLSKTPPPFVRDVWKISDLKPLFVDEYDAYYTERAFEFVSKNEASKSLKQFYNTVQKEFKASQQNFTADEKRYYKKLFHRFSHETNVYLKLGGDKHIGFIISIIKKITTDQNK
jgi:ubiquinone/menaquinone biosynthesis C-methylase UbiE